MRLKSLELQGFKSFPDKTKIKIDHGMTVIVGPNGSGKSNISDAIRFVLGEVSSKNIRGNKMEDVIFGGTDSRRPMGFAMVSLTFDNTEGDMTLPLEYDEVTITRKYFRAGYSEYYIGGKPARLKDITELFMNTGLGKSGYSMIGQGRISEIISKKSEDRRGIFEEAAGISKYRYQKSEAERKLQEADENLSRVTDILSELEGRVGPLEKESEKAKKYLDLYEQKKAADVGLWLYEIDHILDETKKVQSDYEIARHSLEMADDGIRSLENRAEKLSEEERETRENELKNRNALSELTERRHEAENSEMLQKKDIEHFDEEKKRVNEEISLREKDGEKAAEALGEATKKIAASSEQIAKIENELTENEKKLLSLRGALLTDEEEAESAEDGIAARNEELMEAKLELTALEGSDESNASRKEELLADAETLSARIRDAGERCMKGEKAIGDYRKKIDEIKAEDGRYADTLRGYDSEKQALSASLDDEKVRGSVAAKRIEALERMEEHFEGYASSVRFVMEQSRSRKLPGVCGPVSTLLTVDERYTVAIETVLGGNLQNIVVERESDAKAAISLLKAEKAGRATFYPLDIMKPDRLKIDYDRLSKQPGFIGIACDLVECDAKYRDVIDYLLCRSVICTDLDRAAEITRQFGYQFRAVTLDGQVIHPGGSFTGGSVKQDSGMLSRRSQIAKLQKELDTSIGEQKRLTNEIARLDKEIEKTDGERAAAAAGLDMLQVLLSAEDTQMRILQAQIESDRGQQEKIAEQLTALDRQSEQYLERIAEAKNKIAGCEKALTDAETALREIEEKEHRHQEALDEGIEEKNAILLRRGSAVKDKELAERDESAAMSAISSANIAIEALRQELQQLSGRTDHAKTVIQNSEQTLRAIAEALEIAEKEDRESGAKLEEIAKRSEELKKQLREKNHDREIFFRDFTKLETRLGSIAQDQDKYTSRLWDEYELSYSAAAALGYPKLTADNRGAVQSEQGRLRGQIKALGNVNVGAIDEYKEVKERYDFLSGQFKDLTKAKENFTDIIFRLEKEMRIRFEQTFAEVNENFRLVFRELFGGGNSELRLTDPEHPLECGIEINVAPPGKIIKSLSLLSGGEQVFVAIALFFAILKVSPAPFCLLDEIEAALDEVNVARFAAYAKRFSDKTQFIIISHRRGTMEEADELYGVTMQERGISRVLSLNVNEVEARLGEKPV